jgi:hypothetical protein
VKDIVLNLPTFAFVVVTRAALGAGVGLLVSGRLSAARRRALGTTLVAIGAATTIPAAFAVMRGLGRSNAKSPVNRDERLIGARRFPRKGDDDIM